MRFKKVLHPEIVLNLRGDQKFRDLYKSALKFCSYDQQTGSYCITNETIGRLDVNMREHMIMAWRFRANWQSKQKPEIFHVGSDFSKALLKLDRDIPVDRLPEEFFGYFSFSDGAVFDDADEIDGAYVYIGPGINTPVHPQLKQQRSLWCSYVCKQKVQTQGLMLADLNSHLAVIGLPAVGRLLAPVDSGEIGEILGQTTNTDYGTVKLTDLQARNRVYRLLVNLVLYVNSYDPDLLKTSSHAHLSNSQQSRMSQEGRPVNECLLPVTLVSWNYHTPRQYHVDSTWVETYPRWQRCGPGYSQVRLVWVDGHERHYNRHDKKSCVDSGAG